MNFWQFIIEVIHYMAWPATILVLVFVLRKPISSLLKRPIKLRRGDFELIVPRALQEIHENEDLFALTEGPVNFGKYLDLTEAFTFCCGLLAAELRNQPELKELQQLAEDSFNSGVKKIEKERPQTDSLATFRSIESALKSPQKVGWTYRPLHEVMGG